jgi:L-fuculose-phosphate aldolase
MHIEIYRVRPDVEAVVHAHPPRVLALARDGRLPDISSFGSEGCRFGEIIEVAYFEEGSRALAAATAAALREAPACVLMHHGAVTVGGTVERALERMVRLERAAARTRGVVT